MNRMLYRVFTVLISVLCLAIAGPIVTLTHAEQLPNVVFVLIDDMGMGDTRLYNPDAKIPTPNMDRIARAGLILYDAHSTAALCAPTRYGVMTGNYPFRGRKDLGVWPAFDPPMVLDDQRTIGNIMQDAGYHSAMIGKLNNGGYFYSKSGSGYTTNTQDIDFSRAFDRGPTTGLGFDYSYNLLVGIQAQPYAYFENDRLAGNSVDLQVRPAMTGLSSTRKGLRMPDYDSREAGPQLANAALRFIDGHIQKNQQQGSETPFFLYLATQAAHGPYTPPDELNNVQVRGVTGVSDRADMIYEADVVVGQLLDKLEQEDLLSNTLFIVTSDNGVPKVAVDGDSQEEANGHINAQGMVHGIPLRGRKSDIYEGGHRVPFVARWGDGTGAGSTIMPGSRSDRMICLQDLAATLLDLTDQPMPVDQYRDSYSFLPLLQGQDKPVRSHLLMQSGSTSRGVFNRAIRTDGWKLVISSDATDVGEATELYNLRDDLSETNNLIDDPAQKARVAQLGRLLFEQLKSERTNEK